MSSFWIQDGFGPKSNDKCLFKRQKGRRHREEGNAKIEERSDGCSHKPRSTKDCWQPPETGREAWKSFSLRASRLLKNQFLLF